MKKYQVLKWTAEVREKELQCLEEVELLDNHDPVVEFESDSESEAYDFLEKENKLLCIHHFSNCGLKFVKVDCLLLQEVELDEDGNIIECEYINICYPDTKKYDIIKARVQNDLDDLAQDYLNEKYNQEALYEYRK